jgi:hypothetical protein
MRTVLFLIAGLLLLAAFLLLGRMFSANHPGATYAATPAFVCLWPAISATNLWVGVARAGYTLTDELPIFLLIFSVPVTVALVVKWRLL